MLFVVVVVYGKKRKEPEETALLLCIISLLAKQSFCFCFSEIFCSFVKYVELLQFF